MNSSIFGQTATRTSTYSDPYGKGAFPLSSFAVKVDVRVGVNNPGWRKKIADGVDAGSPYSRRVGPIILRNDVVNWTWPFTQLTNVGGRWVLMLYSDRVYGNEPLYQLFRLRGEPAWPSTVSLKSQAKISFLKKVREASYSFNSLPFLGELRETIGMLRSPLKGVRRHTDAYRRAVRNNAIALKKAGHISDLLSDMYLQWTYGVSPLLGDIEKIFDTAKRLVDTDTTDIPLRATVKESVVIERFKNAEITGYTYPRSTSTLHGFTTVESKVQFKGALKVKVHSSLAAKAADITGFLSSEFVPTLWELAPYSFLIDYITNVGDVIGAAFIATGDLRWYWCTTKQEGLHQVLMHTNLVPSPWNAGAPPALNMPAAALVKYVSLNRDRPDLVVSLRDLRLTMPSVKQGVNSVVLGFSKLRQVLR